VTDPGTTYFYRMILQSVTGLPHPPQRIISLVPSQSELLHYLGLETETIGITKFCVHPVGWLSAKTIVGGTKNVNIDLIYQLQPDLIIANKEENVKEQIEELAEHHNVWVTDVNDLDSALQMITDTGVITCKKNEAFHLVSAIENAFSDLEELHDTNNKLQTAYLIWKDPYMTAGGDTFIHDILERCGFQNIFSGRLRYPIVTLAQLQEANCQLVLLSSEPYPFREKHVAELSKHLPQSKILTVDGEMFSWYGSRLLLAPRYFKKLISAMEWPNSGTGPI
jgi:ABC-type Fe3+-hydroxamate transport system substrate-binding protein